MKLIKAKTNLEQTPFKSLLLKRLTSIALMLFLILQFSFDTLAQTLKIQKRNATLSSIFEEIRKQTDYNFIINDKILNKNRSVTVDIQNLNIHQALNKIFASLPLVYKIENKTIIVTEKPAVAATPVNALQDVVQIKGSVKIKVEDQLGPAPGVSVVEKGERRAVITDGQGNYSIRVKKNATLVFSMLGFKSQEINTALKSVVDVVLEEEKSSLSEVIVTGYTTQEKREITGSISSIKARDIENTPILSLDQAMQGRMAGVNVTTATGVPGSAVKVEIRGQGSISAGSEPLYIVDGVPINTSDAGTITSQNPLSFLDPKDIASIEVLKDAAAASIYGAEAANGVVLVTTKRGVEGPTQIDFSYNRGLVTPMPLIEVMNTQQFIDGRIRAKTNFYPNYTQSQIRTEVLEELQLPTTLTDQEILALPSYDWQSATYRYGHSNKLNLAISGGNQQTTFRISSSAENNTGSVVGLNFMRGTMAVRLNHKFSEKLNLRADINLATIKQEGAIGTLGSYTYLSSPQYVAPFTLPMNQIYDENGNWNIQEQGFVGSFRYHALAAAELNDRSSNTNSIVSRLELNYKINPNLRLRSYAGLDYRTILDNQYQDPRTNEALAKVGILRVTHTYPTSLTTTHHLTYSKTFENKHKLSVIGGFEYRSYARKYFDTQGEGFPSYEFRTLASAATITKSLGYSTGVKRVGLFAKADYSFDRKYMFSAIIRRDGSSRFGTDNTFGYFPAVSVGWDLAQEHFAKNIPWLQQLKLRAGYGETGNDAIGNFRARSLYSTTTFDGQAALYPSGLGNTNLRWERNATTNIGLDYSMFRSKLFGSIEVYKKLSKDLLLEMPIPYSTGFESYFKNIGEVQNKGLEIEVGSNIIRTARWGWTTNFNISFLDNKVTKLYDDLTVLPGNSSVRTGYSLQTNFVAQYAGVNSATGKPFFYNADGNIAYYPTGQGSSSYTLDGRGNRLSDYWGGWSNSINYKNLTFDFLFQYDFGREMLNNMALIGSRKGDNMVNGAVWYYENQWTTPGQITSVPRAIQGGVETNALGADVSSTRFLEDASYIRLKSLNLAYKLPTKWTSKWKIANANVFFQALNVLTITNWTGYDPEFFIDGSNFTSNAGVIPQTRSYNLGINVKF
jgi:TonB-linked SusC/RagA family outer membrane protein